MGEMFCFQCQQTAHNKACEGKAGVCGKGWDTSNLQDELTGALIGLSRAVIKHKTTKLSDELVIKGLFTAVTNVNFYNKTIKSLIEEVNAERENISKNSDNYDLSNLWGESNEDIRSLKSLILFGVRGMAAYAHHAFVLGYKNDEVTSFLYEALYSIGETLDAEQLLKLVLKTGEVNYKCMGLLDTANTESYGTPIPTPVPLTIEKGPFIVVSGHDLRDLKLLLEQTEGKGINIYTHSEMLPAHGYPNLKKYKHLKGNFGTAWQSQQSEFHNIPAPILFTTNCLMPVRQSYSDRVFTTSLVSYPELVHIDENKDFTPVIEKALECGGYPEEHHMKGINGGSSVITGFAHGAVLSEAGKIIDLIKKEKIKHIFLIGGCDGAAPGRSYYTELAKKTPMDTIILTLACGKYRINDLELGKIDEFPRIMDMGQCNDAYSAIKVALALAEAFECGVNDLPLSLILSWYEQKAICILLSLLYLGVKNIFLGPTIPAFISQNVLDILVKNYGISKISSPQEDLDKILNKNSLKNNA